MRSPRALLAILAVSAVFSAHLAGCHRSDSILLVEVAGDLRLMPAQLKATITVGTLMPRYLDVPPTPTPFTFPASFSVELDRSLNGPVSIHIDAFDAAAALLGSGDTTQEHINVGDDTILVVTIVPSTPLSDDGGVSD